MNRQLLADRTNLDADFATFRDDLRKSGKSIGVMESRRAR